MNTFNTRRNTPEDATSRLIEAAERLLREGRKPDALTTREIAAEAGLSPGLVNYHFGSKPALVAKALDRVFGDFAPRWEGIVEEARAARNASASSGGDPELAALKAGAEALKGVLKDMAAYTVEFAERGNDFGVKRQLMEGELDNARFVAPILRAFLPAGTDERDVRWAAYFIVVPLQVLFVRADFLSQWTGTDLADRSQRDAIIDSTIDRVLEPFAARAGTRSGHIA